MRRSFLVLVAQLMTCAALTGAADARLPRGAVLSANEQEADPATGVTYARGNAEISIEAFRILGRADAIELQPASNEIHFKGEVRVQVGDERYEGQSVTCDLAFSRCVEIMPDQHSAGDHTVSPSSRGSAATSP